MASTVKRLAWGLVCIWVLSLAHCSSSWCLKRLYVSYALGASLCWWPGARRGHPGGVYLQSQCVEGLHGMKSKELHANMKKTKFPVSNVGLAVLKISGKHSCAVCRRSVGNTSIECSLCMLWVHQRCSGISDQLVADPNYVCKSVMARLGPSTTNHGLKLMSTALCLLWRPISAT